MATLEHPQVVVTSHPNADLDALGSMVAATRLYPAAVPVWSHGASPQALKLLEWLGDGAPAVLDPGRIELDCLATLILVDTANPEGLGPLAAAAADPGVRLVIHDHHEADPDELPPHAERISARAGANTSAMVVLLREQAAFVGPAEATVMAAGIYEDTGMLTYAGVTGIDFESARWLLEQGADLGLVARILHQELTPRQVALFHRLIDNAQMVPGLPYRVLVTAVEDPDTVQDAAGVVQRVMESLEATGVLALIQQGDRVFAIGRAEPEGPDIGAVLADLGGGGHPYAGSASLPRNPLPEVRERAETALRNRGGTPQTVGELASRPVHALPAAITIAQAADRMGRYPLSRMPVVDSEARPRGWVDRALLARAQAHGLGDQELGAYAATLPTLGPEDSLRDAESWILDSDYPLVGVVAEGRLQAVLTRTDLVRSWREASSGAPDPTTGPASRPRDLQGRLQKRLDAGTVEELRELGNLAAEQGVRVFLVGGLVRDLLLGRTNTDVDIAVEGDAIGLAEAFAERRGWSAHSHERFGTVVLEGPEGQRLDLATSRIEHYTHPAALPEVEAGSIKSDLFRRDFTINAMAVELDGDRFGRLLDPFGGLPDLHQGVIRVLHNLSFVEDPTRIVRAVRFETELGFHIDGASERLIRNAVGLGLPNRLSGHRLFRELRYLLESQDPARGLERLRDLGVLPFFHPGLEGSNGQAAVARVRGGEEVLGWYRLLYREEVPAQWQVLTLLLLWDLPPNRLEAVLVGYELRAREAADLARDRRRAEEVSQALAKGELAPSDDVALFEHQEQLSLEGLLATMAAEEGPDLRAGISHYLQHLRGIQPALDGHELRALGVPQGPAIGEWLRALTRARIRGEVHDAEGERALVQSGEIPA